MDEAAVLWALVRGAPGLKLLVTSRVRLRLLGAWELELGGLPLPAGPDDWSWLAGALFLQQAAGRSRAWPRTPRRRRTGGVVRICRRPAGCRCRWCWRRRGLRCGPTRDRRRAGGSGRGAGGAAAGPAGAPAPRRDVLSADWGQLPAADQAVLRWLSLFRGGFSREAAPDVARRQPPAAARAPRRLLVSAKDGGRYELHELVRRCAAREQAGRPGSGPARGALRRLLRRPSSSSGHRRCPAPGRRGGARAGAGQHPGGVGAGRGAGQAELLERLRPGLLRFPRLREATVPPGRGRSACAPDPVGRARRRTG